MKGAIFDFDGTLFDSNAIWLTAGEDYLRALGQNPEAGLGETLSAMSLAQAADYLKKAYGLDLTTEQILRGLDQTVEEFYVHVALPKPGVPEFLARLHRQGVKMCVATATSQHLIEAALNRCGLARYFSGIFTCASVGHGKDEPHIFEAALAFLGTPKEETIVFEDALHAIKTAKAAGFTVVAVFDPYEQRQAEVHALADFCLERF